MRIRGKGFMHLWTKLVKTKDKNRVTRDIKREAQHGFNSYSLGFMNSILKQSQGLFTWIHGFKASLLEFMASRLLHLASWIQYSNNIPLFFNFHFIIITILTLSITILTLSITLFLSTFDINRKGIIFSYRVTPLLEFHDSLSYSIAHPVFMLSSIFI
jgi:hypothetical protein